ncbi:ABC transporter ATP-binding protein [Desulfonatronovibrio hydrogenovorans]|uniref:ABC transporter ATP-binding protein n=1 Tax=Desulfonatronovibrio hydrogenovorans TaxID=53245 RepID=UPI00048A6C3B|nr:ABC transporter ATP-binding protein [Desulfonatronovibrio hydrogenovorans]
MILAVRELCIGYDRCLVLQDLDFSVDPGEMLTILGPNGVGKTTLLKCVNRILNPSKGVIMVEDADVFRMSAGEIARRLGYVAQKSEAGRMTAFDAILLGRKPYLRWKVSDHDLSIVDAAIKRMGLEHLALRHIDQMSGGELQKVCIARALVQEPTVILLDEPTSSLDLKNQLEIMRTIKMVVKGHDIAAVMTMHDLNMAFRFTDKFLFLKNGRVFHHGRAAELKSKMIKEVYGVDVDIISHAGQMVVVPRE